MIRKQPSLAHESGNAYFTASDLNGVTGSGQVEKILLWYRLDANDDGLPDSPTWTNTGIEIFNSSGAFSFDPQNIDGGYEFYTQAKDIKHR